MDAKGRTVRFRPLKDDSLWQVMVYVQGKKGPQRFYTIKMLKNAYGKWELYCNCPDKFYRKSKTGEKCYHEDLFEDYMQKLVADGRAE